MTVRQLLEEIAKLTPEERLEVSSHLSKDVRAVSGIRYVDPDRALAIAKEIFDERAELFRKLAE